MNYLLDRKNKRNKILKVIFSILIFSILIYFRSGIFDKLSVFSHFVFRPVFILGNNIGNKFSNLDAYFIFKRSLLNENEKLKSEINSMSARVLNYDSLLDENNKLKEILGRKDEKSILVLAGILSKPDQNPYDVLVIDAGEDKGIAVGDTVFALGNIPIGRVNTVYSNTAKVVLFSSPGEKTNVAISGRDIFIEMIGRGGGNFEMSLLRDIPLEKGAVVVLPGINSYVVGIVEKIISNPRDSLQKALLISPVNIQGLKFVEVAI